jgi:hypothetical protein
MYGSQNLASIIDNNYSCRSSVADSCGYSRRGRSYSGHNRSYSRRRYDTSHRHSAVPCILRCLDLLCGLRCVGGLSCLRDLECLCNLCCLRGRDQDAGSSTNLAGLAAGYGSITVRIIADGRIGATELLKCAVSGAIRVPVRIARLGVDLRPEERGENQDKGASVREKRAHF